LRPFRNAVTSILVPIRGWELLRSIKAKLRGVEGWGSTGSSSPNAGLEIPRVGRAILLLSVNTCVEWLGKFMPKYDGLKSYGVFNVQIKDFTR
jgi:hypothetical protein